MSKLALNIIADDEVEKCAEIINLYQQYFDEIVIAADKRIDEFNSLASEKIKILKYEWCDDFAHKRNFLAANTESEYYFRLDTDDKILNPEQIRNLFNFVLANKIDLVFVVYDYAKDNYGNIIAQHWRDTIVKKRPDIRWNKKIHENILVDDPNKCKLHFDRTIKLAHEIDDAHIKKSQARNFKYLLEEFVQDGEKTDPRTLAYLGRVMMGAKEYDKAIAFLQKLVLRSGWDDDKYFAFIQMSQCYQMLNKYDLAIACCYEALTLNTKFPDAYLQMGHIYCDKQDFNKAVDWIMPGIVRPIPDTVMVIDPSFYGIKAKMGAAIALYGKGDIEKATKYYFEAKNLCNGDPEVLKYEKVFVDAMEESKYTKELIWMINYLTKRESIKVEKLVESIPSNLNTETTWKIRSQFIKPKAWSDKEIAIFCGPAWEEWGPASVIAGIGGSEEAVIYLSKELVKQGYSVTVYNSCGDMTGVYEGVEYKPYQMFNFNDNFNILIEWRNYSLQNIKARQHYIWLHDLPLPGTFNKDNLNNIDKVFVLSEYHKLTLLDQVPEEKIFVTANGINVSDFNNNGVIRNPKRMIYTSSYDRGIEHLLKMWSEVRSVVPDAELHIFYGWNTYDKMMESGRRTPEFKDYMVKLIDQPGVFDHGRVGHKKLIKELHMSGIWAYPSHFEEISCISAMKAQAAGCVPVCTDYAALKETVKAGVKVKGSCHGDESKKEFKEKIIEILKDEQKQSLLREEVLKNADSFGWDKVAVQWKELFSSKALEVTK